MVDATDLKSVGLSAREGSSPSPGTTMIELLCTLGGCFLLWRDRMKDFGKKSNLEKTIAVGVHGAPELRRDEKRRFLGFFRERVIEALTFSQIRTKEGLEVMGKALEDTRAVELVIHQRARAVAMPLIVQARRKGLDFTIVSNPDFVGEIAVILVAKDAVDVAQVWAERS